MDLERAEILLHYERVDELVDRLHEMPSMNEMRVILADLYEALEYLLAHVHVAQHRLSH